MKALITAAASADKVRILNMKIHTKARVTHRKMNIIEEDHIIQEEDLLTGVILHQAEVMRDTLPTVIKIMKEHLTAAEAAAAHVIQAAPQGAKKVITKASLNNINIADKFYPLFSM